MKKEIRKRQLVAPSNVALPTITADTLLDGEVAVGGAGVWVGVPSPTFAYEWQSAATLGGSYSAIGGATSVNYTIAVGDITKFIRLKVTATNSQGSAFAISVPIGPIASSAGGLGDGWWEEGTQDGFDFDFVNGRYIEDNVEYASISAVPFVYHTRATVATHRNRSLALLTAAINEPCVSSKGWSVQGGGNGNLFVTPGTPATQTITVESGQSYVFQMHGTGTFTMSGAGAGTATEHIPFIFTASTTSLTCTKGGSGTFRFANLFKGTLPENYRPASLGTSALAADECGITLPGLTETTLFFDVAFPVAGRLGIMYVTGSDPGNDYVEIARRTDNKIHLKVFDGGVQVANIVSSGTYSGKSGNIIARLKTNDVALFVDGVKIGADTSCAIPELVDLTLSFTGADGSWNSQIYRATAHPLALDDATILARRPAWRYDLPQKLSHWRSGSGLTPPRLVDPIVVDLEQSPANFAPGSYNSTTGVFNYNANTSMSLDYTRDVLILGARTHAKTAGQGFLRAGRVHWRGGEGVQIVIAHTTSHMVSGYSYLGVGPALNQPAILSDDPIKNSLRRSARIEGNTDTYGYRWRCNLPKVGGYSTDQHGDLLQFQASTGCVEQWAGVERVYGSTWANGFFSQVQWVGNDTATITSKSITPGSGTFTFDVSGCVVTFANSPISNTLSVASLLDKFISIRARIWAGGAVGGVDPNNVIYNIVSRDAGAQTVTVTAAGVSAGSPVSGSFVMDLYHNPDPLQNLRPERLDYYRVQCDCVQCSPLVNKDGSGTLSGFDSGPAPYTMLDLGNSPTVGVSTRGFGSEVPFDQYIEEFHFKLFPGTTDPLFIDPVEPVSPSFVPLDHAHVQTKASVWDKVSSIKNTWTGTNPTPVYGTDGGGNVTVSWDSKPEFKVHGFLTEGDPIEPHIQSETTASWGIGVPGPRFIDPIEQFEF